MDVFSVDMLWAYLTLTLMEIILGIDNIVFISISVAPIKNPKIKEITRKLGLFMALFMRLALLFSITWVMSLKYPLFSLLNYPITGKDIILIGGGLFLLVKATFEIHDRVSIEDHKPHQIKHYHRPAWIIIQIMILDIVFSLDSIITAVGMSRDLVVMSSAIITAVMVMLIFAKTIGDFIDRHPSIKMLALSFLLLIGIMLIAEGFDNAIDKGYIYFAIAFSLFVEALNLQYQSKIQKVRQHK